MNSCRSDGRAHSERGGEGSTAPDERGTVAQAPSFRSRFRKRRHAMTIDTRIKICSRAGAGRARELRPASREPTRPTEQTVDNATLAKLTLTSAAFRGRPADPDAIYLRRRRPDAAASWGDRPPGTKSFALVIDDPDAPSGTFRHWGVYDIPASARSIGGGAEDRHRGRATTSASRATAAPARPRATAPTIIISSCSRSTSTGSSLAGRQGRRCRECRRQARRSRRAS